MAYATKYYAQNKSYRDGVTRRVNLMLEGYGGAENKIQYYDKDPMELYYHPIDKIEERSIQESELRFRFVLEKDELSTYEEIYESDYGEWKIQLLEDSVVEWEGFVQPDQMNRTFIDNLILVDLSCTDGLRDLRDVRFTHEVAGGFDRAKIFDVIQAALSPIGFELDFRIQVDIRQQTHGSVDVCAFLDTYINRHRFKNIKDGIAEYDTCYEVIEKTLKGWNVFLKQSGGKYRIINKIRPKQDYFVVEWDGTVPTGAAGKESISTEDISSDKTFKRGGNLSKIPSLKELIVAFFNRNLGGKVADVDFNDFSGTGPWAIGFNSYSEESPGSLGVNELKIITGHGDEGSETRALTLNDDFSVAKITDSDYIQISFAIKVEEIIIIDPLWVDALSLYFYIRVKRPDGTIVGDLSHHQIANVSSDYTYFQSLIVPDLKIVEDGDYNIFIQFFTDGIPPLVEYIVKFQLTDINIRAAILQGTELADDVSYDMRYRASYDKGKKREETRLYFNDTINSADLGGLFRLDSGSYINTETWWDGYYWGSDTYAPFINIFTRDYLTIRQKYIDYVKFGFIDANNKIKPETVLTLNSKDYIIVGYKRDFKSGTLDLTVVENVKTPITFHLEHNVMDSIDGQSRGGSVAVVSGGGSVNVLHGMTDPAYHKASTEANRGKIVRANLTTGAIEFSEELDPVFGTWRDLSRPRYHVFAAPNNADGEPSWRRLLYSDIDNTPTIPDGISGLTAGVIPKAATSTTLEDSILSINAQNKLLIGGLFDKRQNPRVLLSDGSGVIDAFIPVSNDDPEIGAAFAGGMFLESFTGTDGKKYGIIVANEDVSDAEWGCSGTNITTEFGIGKGKANTEAILAGCATRPIAASRASDYTGGGKDDWFLPSSSELWNIYQNKSSFGISTGIYWSSNQSSDSFATAINMTSGITSPNKADVHKVRPVRYELMEAESGYLRWTGSTWKLETPDSLPAGTANQTLRYGSDWIASSLLLNNGTSIGVGAIPASNAQQLNIEKSIRLENTTGSDVGVIYKGADRFIHNHKSTIIAGFNTFVGKNSGNFTLDTDTPIEPEDDASYNTGVGDNTLQSLTSGYVNTAVGALSMEDCTSGWGNSGFGSKTLRKITSGVKNTAIGVEAGTLIDGGLLTVANECVFIGYASKAKENNATNEIVIGYNTTGNGSNTATIGNSSITGLFLPAEAYQYFGADANDSWRMGRSGNNFVFQRKESNNWVTKETLTP